MPLRLAIFDYEGVLSEGGVFSFQDSAKTFSTFFRHADVDALAELRLHGVKVAVISSYDSETIRKEAVQGLGAELVKLGEKEKWRCLPSICAELGYDVSEVAYFTTCFRDELSNVGLVGCPGDLTGENASQFGFVSEKLGGQGCVNDFCQVLMKSNSRYTQTISCVVPCSNSAVSAERVKDVNTRKFANSSLLEMKVDVVLRSNFSEIVLTTDDESAVDKFARGNSVKVHRRDSRLCKPGLSHDALYESYLESICSEAMFHTTPISPFLSVKSIDKLLNFWRTNSEYDLVVFSQRVENILTNCVTDVPLQQVGFIVDANAFRKHKSLSKIQNCKHILLDDMERMCIKSNYDFAVAESLVYRCLNNVELIDNYMKNSRFDSTKILDCTIRDAGYMNNWAWSYDTVKKFVHWMGEIGVEYCEIGFFKDEKFVEDGAGVWRNLLGHLDMIQQLKLSTKSKIAVMVDTGSNREEKYIDHSRIPARSQTAIDLIRVFCYIEILDEGITYCKHLKEKGYTVSLNIGYAAHLELPIDVECIKAKVRAKAPELDYLYFADSLGMLTPNDLTSFMCNLKEMHPIKNGFHNHDNQGTVFGNLISLINCKIDIVDATVSGFGKNGGNANLEQLIMYLCIKERYELDLLSLLQFLEEIKHVDFGEGNHFDISKAKMMLQQFMDIHVSHANFNLDIVSLYNQLRLTPNKKKVRL